MNNLREIAGQYGLSISSVYAAMAYYFDRREEIDLWIARDEAWVEAFRQHHPSRYIFRINIDIRLLLLVLLGK
jgi:hypothetical protein